MVYKATKLRASLYRVLDQVLESGSPVEIERKGRRLRIELVEGNSKLSRLKKRKVMKEDPDSYVSLDWSKEWEHDLP